MIDGGYFWMFENTSKFAIIELSINSDIIYVNINFAIKKSVFGIENTTKIRKELLSFLCEKRYLFKNKTIDDVRNYLTIKGYEMINIEQNWRIRTKLRKTLMLEEQINTFNYEDFVNDITIFHSG